MFEHAVVGVDFSPASEAIVGCLPELRALGTDTLSLAYVASVAYPAGSAIAHQDHYRARLAELAAGIREHGFAVHSDVVAGYPAVELIALAERVGAGLIVLGSRGHSMVQRLFLGSTALKVLHDSPTAVLLERIEPVSDHASDLVCERKLERVLLATDMTEAAMPATNAWLSLVRSARAVAAVTVIDAQGEGDAAVTRAHLEQLVAGVEVPVALHVVASPDAAEAIATLAKVEGVSLVILGRGGHGGRRLGATADGVVRRSEVPVLVLPH